tara:strand:- start:55 stop:249 length:195 start_codon:yes stop_codon:yes gene_type:complete
MSIYKIHTKWVGYSEVDIEADSKDQAIQKFYDGDYDFGEELLTGNGLDKGFENEEVLFVVKLGG